MKSKRNGLRVLVVEDDAQLLELAQIALGEAGYVVEAVADGASALRLLERRPADLHAMVLDLVLHDMPGRIVLRRAKQLRPDLPVILASGADTSGVVGADVVIPKPYGPQDIIDALDALIAAPSGMDS